MSGGQRRAKVSAIAGICCKTTGESNIPFDLYEAFEEKFEVLVLENIVSDDFASKTLEGIEEQYEEPYGSFALSLKASEWEDNLVVVLRNLERQIEGDDPVLAYRANKLLKLEIEYTYHIGVRAVILNLTSTKCANLARTITQYLSGGTLDKYYFFLKVRMARRTDQHECPWTMWNMFRTFCEYPSRLYVVLEITYTLPSEDEICRWLGEPVKYIFVSQRCFQTDSKGERLLRWGHKKLIRRFMRIGAIVVFNFDSSEYYSVNDIVGKSYRKQVRSMWAYIKNQQSDAAYDHKERIKASYNYLNLPLEASDNSKLSVGEKFESQPLKYQIYKAAVIDALCDLVKRTDVESKTIIALVLGVGRGPLIRVLLSAAASVEIKIRVYAVEKNEISLTFLQHSKWTEWQNEDLHIVASDIAEWVAPEMADLIVADMFGCFGDNELLSEAMDSAQRFLNHGGIMLPQSYSNYLGPTMSSDLYHLTKDATCEPFFVSTSRMTTNSYQMADPQKLFDFFHPNGCARIAGNQQFRTLTFLITQNAVLHGFSGYSTANIYGAHKIGNLPEVGPGIKRDVNDSGIFFPTRFPMQLRQGDELTVRFWRCLNKKSIWYEWCTAAPFPQPIQNTNGISFSIPFEDAA